MRPLFTEAQFQTAKATSPLSCECYNCQKPFDRPKKYISYERLHNKGQIRFCSLDCFYTSKTVDIETTCNNCFQTIFKKEVELKKTKNHFCGRSCATVYRNKNKTHGTRRSKLEVWLETQLPSLYPTLDFHFNRKDAIGSELDVYVPALRLAIELNGIFHYEPIFGTKKLDQIQNNDISKTQACINKEIDLCIIDVSGFNHFKPLKAKKYLDIITTILDERLLTS